MYISEIGVQSLRGARDQRRFRDSDEPAVTQRVALIKSWEIQSSFLWHQLSAQKPQEESRGAWLSPAQLGKQNLSHSSSTVSTHVACQTTIQFTFQSQKRSIFSIYVSVPWGLSHTFTIHLPDTEWGQQLIIRLRDLRDNHSQVWCYDICRNTFFWL